MENSTTCDKKIKILPKSMPVNGKTPSLRRGHVTLNKHKKAEKCLTRAPDGGWGWLVVLAGFTNTAIASTLTATYSLIFSSYFKDYGVSASTASWIFNMNQFASNFFSILVGPLIFNYGWRWVALVGSLLMSFSMMANAFVIHVEALFITYSLLSGIGQSMTCITSIVIVVNYFDKKKGLASGLTSFGFCAGIFIGPLIVRFLVDNYGYRASFLLLGSIVMNSAAASMIFHPIEWHVTASAQGDSITENHLGKNSKDESVTRNLIEDSNPSLRSQQKLENNFEQQEKDVHCCTPSGNSMDKFNSSSEGVSNTIIMISSHSQINDLQSFQKIESVHPEPSLKSCPLSQQLKKITVQILNDLMLLRKSTILILTLSKALLIGSYANFLMMFPFAMYDKEYQWNSIAWSMSVAGLGNFIGRVIITAFVDYVPFSTKYFFIVGSFGVFVSLLMVSLVNSYSAILFFMSCFGLSFGLCICVLALIVMEFAGLDVLSRVLGLVGLLTSIFFLICAPLLGFLQGYRNAFLFAIQILSAAALLSSILMCFMPCAVKWDARKKTEDMIKENA